MLALPSLSSLSSREATYQDLIDAIYEHADHVGACPLPVGVRAAPGNCAGPARPPPACRSPRCAIPLPPYVRPHLNRCTEPWSAGTARTPSTAWCVLYRMLCMRLTRNQMKAMLNHGVSRPLPRPLPSQPPHPHNHTRHTLCATPTHALTAPPPLSQDSVYIRAVGFLYLRLATDPGDLWDWFSPYLDDEQEITPGADASSRTYVPHA